MTRCLLTTALLFMFGTGMASAQKSEPDTIGAFGPGSSAIGAERSWIPSLFTGEATGRENDGFRNPDSLARLAGLHSIMPFDIDFRVPYLLNLRNSAPVGGDAVYWNTDAVPDTSRDSLGNIIGLDSVAAVWVNYSSDNQASWESLPQQRIDELFYEETWEGMKLLPDSGSITCYYAASNDSGSVSTESPSNVNNTWPPGANLLAYTGDEPNDDCQIPGRSNLELTGFLAGHSDQYLYFRLLNLSGLWPYRAGFLGPWFFYGAVIVNPRQFLHYSSYAYLAVRVDITLPGIIVLPPGLYRFDVENPFETLVRVGDIDQHVSDSELDLRFRFSDLIDDPEFGTYEGYVGVVGITAQATNSGELTFADLTQACRFYQTNGGFIIGDNAAPFLTDTRVNPEVGEPGDTFRFSVTYLDPDNHFPVVRRLQVGADSYRVGSPDRDYTVGASFSIDLTGFPLGWHRFNFEFSDGQDVITSAVDSFQVIGLGQAEIPAPGTALRLAFAGRRLAFAPDSSGLVELELFDALGRRVWSMRERTDGSIIKVEFPRELRTGVYFLKLTGPGAAIGRKLVLIP